MSEALCVRVSWGDRRVATHVLHPGHELGLTPTGEPSPVPALRFEAGERHFAIGFHDGMVGEVLRNGQTPLSLGDAVHRGLASEGPRGWSLEVGRADVVRLGRGPVHFEAFRVQAPPRAPVAGELDYRFLNTLLLCLALFGVAVMQTQLVEPLDEDELTSSEATRMRRILVQTTHPPAPKVQPVGEVVKATRRLAQAAEGRARPPTKPQKDTGGLTAAGVSRQLFGGPGSAGVLGPGGLGSELRGALGSVVSASGDGLGGWSLRGNGAGGPGGERAGIGAIPTSGVAGRSGVGRLCGGPGPCKESRGPELPPEPPLSCEGCMDKELIRKVIASHREQVRYCYELALQQSPSLAGKVSISFLVAGSGDVPMARVEQSTVPSAALGECLVSRVRSWKFPSAKGDTAGYRVTYPFVFKPSGG